jgi:hypothetical protein
VNLDKSNSMDGDAIIKYILIFGINLFQSVPGDI